MKDFLLNLVLGTLTAPLRAWPQQRINGFLVRFGHAFRPPGLCHFSELSLAEQQELLARVPVLRTNHSDYPAPLRWVPRTLTTWLGSAPTRADVLMSSPVLDDPLKPIPAPGQWYVLRGYLTSTSMEGWADRIGWRFDDVDQYYSLSVSVKLR